MTSVEIQDRLTAITTEIATKQLRLAEIPAEKARSLTNDKLLVTLEKEEAEVAGAIDRLTKRLPLLQESLEIALREEAGVRLRSLEKEGAAVAAQVGGDTQQIRHELAHVLGLIERAGGVWADYRRVAGEAQWLAMRFSLPPLREPAVDRFATDEIKTFASVATERVQRSLLTATEWTGLIENLREARRRETERAERERPQRPIMTDRSGPALAEAREELRRKELAHYGLRDARRQPNP